MTDIGTTVRRLRKEQDWTQEELARRVGVVPSMIGLIERGERLPSVPTVVELARALCTTTDALLGTQVSENTGEPVRGVHLCE